MNKLQLSYSIILYSGKNERTTAVIINKYESHNRKIQHKKQIMENYKQHNHIFMKIENMQNQIE